jgi:hypothetical protein
MHTLTKPNFVRRAMATRRGRVLLVLGVMMLAAGVTAAAAFFFATAKVAGGGRTGTFALAWEPTGSTLDTTATTIKSTTAPTISSGTATLPSGLVFFPSDKYVWSGYVKSTGSDGYVSGVSMPSLPAGYTARLVSGCGATVGSSALAQVKVEIALSSTATPDGRAWTLDPTAGVQAIPASQGAAPTTCPTYTGQ